jgi:2-polyprenyl-3-methyl-5-hydroxy-6-metoxy-1,4-benzoquinol methylase
VAAASVAKSQSQIAKHAQEVEAVFRSSSVLPAEYNVGEYLKYHAERLAFDYSLAQENVARAEQLLEVGAFPFLLTHTLRRTGYSVSAVDYPLPEIAAIAQSLGISSTSCNIETERLPFIDATWDHVIFNEVFEHLRIDPIFTVRELHRVLRPGGRLWLSTPNLRSIRGIYNFLVKGEAWSAMGEGLYHMYAKVGAGGPAGHVREYTSQEVAAFATACGFEVEQVIYRGRYSSLLAAAAGRVFPSLLPYFTVVAQKT